MTVISQGPKRSLVVGGSAAADAASAGAGVSLWRLHSDAVNERLVARWLPSGLGAVLKTDLYDEAVSPGLYPALRMRAERVVGIDLSSSVAAAAATRAEGLEASVADVRRLPFEADSFDAVVSNSTLDHLSGQSQAEIAIAEIARVLRPGGPLMITLDNPLNPLVALRNRLPAKLSRRLRQGFRFEPGWTCGPRRLRALLTAGGLDVRSQTAIMHAPRALVARVGPRSARAEERLIRRLLGFEALEAAPTRYLTGHFVAALATKPGDRGVPRGSR